MRTWGHECIWYDSLERDTPCPYLSSTLAGAIRAGLGGTSPPLQSVGGINDESDPVNQETRLVFTP